MIIVVFFNGVDLKMLCMKNMDDIFTEFRYVVTKERLPPEKKVNFIYSSFIICEISLEINLL